MSNAFGKFFAEQGAALETKPEESKPEERRVIGKITKIKLNDEDGKGGGWGFISSKEIAYNRIFFHWTSLRQDTLQFTDLKIGMKVEFTPVWIEVKRWRAIKVKVIE